MGLRQPSATGAYFAQASAGSAKQKEARDKLKKPQAIGGSAGVGTQMVAATTDVQQKAAQNVQATGQQAGKDLNVNEGAVGSSTVSTIGGTPVASSPTPTATAQQFTGGVGTYNPPEAMPVISGAQFGDVEQVVASTKQVENALTQITNQIDELNNKIKSANAADRKTLEDEKTRLEGILKSYQDKLTNENLGQIAGPSEFEQQMLEREQLLAEEGGDVGQIAALFGRKAGDIRTGKYGALESQIYGKDLEAIREAARAGLIDLGEAERATDTALEGYTGQIETSKKGYEERLAKESKKLDLLEASPQELAGYSRKELTDLFGKDVVDRLFTFSGTDDAAKVTNTKMSETRKALEDRSTKLKDELAKAPGEQEKAQAMVDANYNTVESSVFGKGEEPGAFGKISSVENEIKEAMGKFDELNSRSAFTRKRGHSKEVNYWQTVIGELQDGYRKLSKLKNEAQSIKDDKSLTKSQKTIKLKEIKTNIDRVAEETKANRSRHRI
jgi:hypothetical protein